MKNILLKIKNYALTLNACMAIVAICAFEPDESTSMSFVTAFYGIALAYFAVSLLLAKYFVDWNKFKSEIE